MKKKVLLITFGFPFGVLERSFLSTEAEELSSRYDVSVLAVVNSDEPLLYDTFGIQRVERLTFSSLHKSRNWRAWVALFRPGTILEAFRAAKQNGFYMMPKSTKEILSYAFHIGEAKEIIRKIVKEEKIDIIYTYWCSTSTLAAVELKKDFPHIKVITRFHGADLYEERADINYQPFRRKVAAKCDRLVFACEAGRDYYLAHWGQKWAKKSIVSYLGCVPLMHIPTQKSECLTMVSCSNAIPLKRIHLIIEALERLPEAILVDWHHIGDGSELESLKQMAFEHLTAHANIRWKFWGNIFNHELDSVYQEIQPNLFITLTETEGGAPVSIQEIFSAGVPAIGTAVGGIPEQIQTGKTGYLLSPNPDPAEVAEAIAAFYHAELKERQAMSDATYALWQEKFDAQKNAETFCAMVEGL